MYGYSNKRLLVRFQGEGQFAWPDDPDTITVPSDPNWEWPVCTIGCVEFPEQKNYRPIDEDPLLPTSMTGFTKEYVCSIR